MSRIRCAAHSNKNSKIWMQCNAIIMYSIFRNNSPLNVNRFKNLKTKRRRRRRMNDNFYDKYLFNFEGIIMKINKRTRTHNREKCESLEIHERINEKEKNFAAETNLVVPISSYEDFYWFSNRISSSFIIRLLPSFRYSCFRFSLGLIAFWRQ